jgi:hypothetical protein
MKREVTLSYNQLRQILCLTISNKTLKAKLEDFLSGKVTKVSEVELLELISESEADIQLILQSRIKIRTQLTLMPY